MTHRKGIVVEVHAADHAVDLVMVDTGARMTGVQVQTTNGSARSGSVDLPEAPVRKSKWDITEAVDGDVHALVTMVGRTPVVTGFLYPQVNKMLSTDPKVSIQRTKSDVIRYDDGNGNFGVLHPSGASIIVGATPDAFTFPSMADSAVKPDRNTDQKTYIRVALAGQAVDIVLSPDGTGKISMKTALEVTAPTMTFTATDSMKFDTPTAHFTGDVTSDGDMTAGDISLQKHLTSGVKEGNDTSKVPVAG